MSPHGAVVPIETNMTIQRRGIMFAISSPSGAGKTSLCRLLLERCDNLKLSISVTTRPKRPNEVDGVDYIFRDPLEFRYMLMADNFIEHAEVFSHLYGTPRMEVEKDLREGRDILFDIDWQGVQQLAKWRREDLVSLFLLPPSAAELERRLETRAQDTENTIRDRMKMAAKEIGHYNEYDYVIVNHDLAESSTTAEGILQAERLRRSRQTDLNDFVEDLRYEL